MEKFGKKAILLGVESTYNKDSFDSLDELETLCKTLEIEVVDKVIQRRVKPDSVTYVGSGKLHKIKDYCLANSIDLIVIDDEITPIQLRNIEEITGLKVVDRTQIILEIFSKHASTHEGKLQVEMAKLIYDLPRLRGKGLELSNPGGGIGTRGPGETILELDRRRIKDRISQLKKELEKIRKNRHTVRKSRLESGYYIFSVVGYTNAGKSTLLSALSKEEDIIISDKMFSTLNPTVRRIKLPDGRFVLLSDTVGFIRKLPHTLVEAFHSTLEEILYSDVIIILVDVSDTNYKKKLSASFSVLEEIKANDKPYFIVFNKIDLVPEDYLDMIRYEYPNSVFISAKSKLGFEVLYKKIREYIDIFDIRKRIHIKAEQLSVILKYADFIEWNVVEYLNDGYILDIKGPENIVEKISKQLKDDKQMF
ncbi:MULTISPECIES: GTPase HflX [Fervidobacterium]|uniref:GTPase HflX n=1 Tax=Fervidobacterium nodosum (strain ATCC 35602 / DSM 5306 / Rt17-B1) TaxID=381764 RepID=A7HJA6_FERNB|nr:MULTISPECIES: GTPase HflX [Fervidobacterium]ABS59989.1 GTP-binding protein HSR1-related [Fervidobacterium nodosum Rt17-B1]